MQLQFAEITRGNGKIFVRLDVPRELAEAQFEVVSRVDEGSFVPVRLLPAPDGVSGKVLVAPVLDVTQTVTATARDSHTFGDLANAQLVLEPSTTKHRSQLNTALRNRVALAIRNCDEGQPWSDDSLQVEVLRLIDHGPEDIAHIEINLRGCDRESVMGKLDLRLLNKSGHSVTLDEPINMGDSVKEDTDFPGYFHRKVLLSQRISHDANYAIAWLRAECADGSAHEFVEMWDAARFEEMRRKWFYDSLAADRDPIYDQWFRDRHQAKPWELDAQRMVALPRMPKFSLVVPLFRTDVSLFEQMVSSVLAQTYANFQLVLVNASPECEELSAAARRYQKQDARVTLVELDRNRGIAGNTNAGIEAANGDFVGFLDHDDLIEPDLLYWYAKAVNDYPTTDLLYCDEDKLRDGHYEQAFFKPDWSPDLLRSQNYVTHLLMVRSTLLAKVGNIHPEFDGAQDHDLVLRAGERARNVFHLRKVRYHWRITNQSTAASGDAKSYAQDAGLRAVQVHLNRVGVKGRAYEDARIPNLYHVKYELDKSPLVSIVIPNKDAAELLDQCVHSILTKSTYSNFEIVVVENNSTDSKTFALYDELQALDSRVRVVTYYPEAPGFNFAKIMNFGIAQSVGEYVLMLNNDVEVITPGWIEALLGHALERRVGCVGAKLLYPDGTIQHAGVIVHRGGPSHTGIYMPRDTDNYFHAAQTTRDFLGVTGACLLVRRALFDQLGGLDESFAVDFNDVDFCLRVRDAGYWNVYEPTCELYHYESVSRGKNDTPAKRCRFRAEGAKVEKARPYLYEITDPFMNPNLWPINPYWHLDV